MLHASDLLDPKGDLEAAILWPGVEVSVASESIDEYLAEGYANAAGITDTGDKDEAARQWAYYKAYRRKWKALAGMPSSVSVGDEGSSSFTAQQIAEWKGLADEAFGIYESYLTASETTVGVAMNRASESRPLNFTF